MAQYTAQVSERMNPLAKIDAASYSAEQVTAWVSLSNYNRAFAVINVGAIAANRQIQARLEQATGANGEGQKVIAGKESAVLLTADQNGLIAIELQTEELDVNGGYDHVLLKLMIQGGAIICGAVLYGCEPRYAPVGQANWIEVIDK